MDLKKLSELIKYMEDEFGAGTPTISVNVWDEPTEKGNVKKTEMTVIGYTWALGNDDLEILKKYGTVFVYGEEERKLKVMVEFEVK